MTEDIRTGKFWNQMEERKPIGHFPPRVIRTECLHGTDTHSGVVPVCSAGLISSFLHLCGKGALCHRGSCGSVFDGEQTVMYEIIESC